MQHVMPSSIPNPHKLIGIKSKNESHPNLLKTRLGHVLVAVTSHTRNRNCLNLRDTIRTIEGWGYECTSLRIVIYTNLRDPTLRCIYRDHHDWKPTHTHTHKTIVVQIDLAKKNPFLLSHAYKSDWAAQLRDGKPVDTWAYLEDDMQVDLKTLLAWRDDTALLEAHGLVEKGFSRSFFRFEVDARNRTFAVDTGEPQTVGADVHILAVGKRNFVSMKNPYCAVTVATHQQIKEWVEHPLFNSEWHGHYGIQEFAANGIQYSGLNLTDGFEWRSDFRALVPVESQHGKWKLRDLALVHHLSNKYINKEEWDHLRVRDVFV